MNFRNSSAPWDKLKLSWEYFSFLFTDLVEFNHNPAYPTVVVQERSQQDIFVSTDQYYESISLGEQHSKDEDDRVQANLPYERCHGDTKHRDSELATQQLKEDKKIHSGVAFLRSEEHDYEDMLDNY